MHAGHRRVLHVKATYVSPCPLKLPSLQFCREAIQSEWTVRYKLVPDEQPQIETAIRQLVRNSYCGSA